MILVVVCHPDDEALWFGGSLNALTILGSSEVCVLCLSGRDANSLRENEFHEAMSIAGYSKGVVLGFSLRDAHQALPNISETVKQGLVELGYDTSDIELLITHSPYGDEHRHPHHVQAYQELFSWTKKKKVPLGFFSTIPLPIGGIRSCLHNYQRKDQVHLNFFGHCTYSLLDILRVNFFYGRGWMPKFYCQWQINSSIKKAMLNCYESINLKQHEEGYAMFTSGVESFYLCDEAGLSAIKALIEKMDVPGASDLFDLPSRPRVFASNIYRRLKNALHS